MKFPFLRRFISRSKQNSVDTKIASQSIPEEEVRDVFHLAIDEVMEAPSNIDVDQADILAELKIDLPPKKEVAVPQESHFETLKEINGSKFEYDKLNGIPRITWQGDVGIEEASVLVTLGADYVEFHGCRKLLLDRSSLLEFDTEARMWIKDLLKTRAKRIVKMVDKLAIIKPHSAKGSIFSNFIASAIGLVFPGLEMMKFDSEEEAVSWLNE